MCDEKALNLRQIEFGVKNFVISNLYWQRIIFPLKFKRCVLTNENIQWNIHIVKLEVMTSQFYVHAQFDTNPQGEQHM